MAHYVDTSALLKLVVDEAESTALMTWLAETDRRPATALLARTELLRAVGRWAPQLRPDAYAVLDAMIVLPLTADEFERAGTLQPVELRSLDAVHIAAALDLGDDLEALVTYDHRMAEAARRSGIAVLAPE